MAELLDEMARARLPWLHPRLRSWYGDVQLTVQVKSAMETEVGRVGDVDFGASYRNDAGVGVGAPLDWANRRIALRSGGWAVTGIRFRGRDIERPFVDVIAASEPPTPDGLSAVAEAVVRAYEQFSPRCLRVETANPAALVAKVAEDPRFGDHSGIDMHIVAGMVDELLDRPRVPGYQHIALRRGGAAPLAEQAATIYRELTDRQPDTARWATPEDAESLADCAAQDLLFEVVADGDSAGVVAAIRHDAHGMTGFSVQEICLDVRHRGRHLAAGVMQHLLENLSAKNGDVLCGTIHPDNTASLRNALSIGRELVGGYAWITPTGLPGMAPS
jgi:L-amino acid N-acyltransferase YncA